ncbi:glycoside hydrolase family 32 protein [Altibacter sp. HG106]|uniref:glycoside hydrolase family 32 protein n=1 Tax=Altibacter sp. HG106 TaxID=3023937 RepID=UPI002350CB20|nr:glycoside hydrolase family 32 protein [Altibacter sp. HG106]MDC7994260.1 glycoside hydrolase family 32 protein [Altibacter sp. HG106]
MKTHTLLIICYLFLGCQNQTDTNATKQAEEKTPATYQEPFRPQFHFSPKSQWMNDPNGLVYENGTYHLFYQYYPEDTVWGPMHWGHASSEDLISWKHHPIALYPDEHGYIFSGSAVIDSENSSGFGKNGSTPIVAVFTYHQMEGEKAGRNDFQTQGIAYSLDHGMSWVKYENNPVISNATAIRDFRDPKVFWHEEDSQWVMVLVAGDHTKFYKSYNLKEWEWMSDFGKTQGAHGGVWECPDLFKLPVQGTDLEKWVLLVSVNPGAPNGGSGTQYFVGDFDGSTFTADSETSNWIDYGRDNYAGVTYNNAPDDQRIFIGWMSNWDYAQTTPTKSWRSAMTLPRALSLHQDTTGYFLRMNPVASFQNYIEMNDTIPMRATQDRLEISMETLGQTAIQLEINLSEEYTFTYQNEKGEAVVFKLLPKQQIMTFDRSHSGRTDFNDSFVKNEQIMPYKAENRWVKAQFIVDRSSLELFIHDGRYVMTNLLFPTETYTEFTVTHTTAAPPKNISVGSIPAIWMP